MAKSKVADAKVTELMAHGYSKTAATRALHDAHNDSKRALDILQTQQRKAERAAAQQERIRQAAAAATTAAGDGDDDVDDSGNDQQHKQQQQQQREGATATRRVLTHPCIDVFGKCAYGQQCMLRNLPRNACIHHYHGSCVFGDACQRAHYDADGVDIAAHRKQRLQQQQPHTLTVNGQVYTLTQHARGGVQTAVVAAPQTQREPHHDEYDEDDDDDDSSSSSSNNGAHDGEDGNGAAAVVRPVPYLERLRKALGADDNNSVGNSSGKHHKNKKSSGAVTATSSSSPSIALHPCIAQFGNCRFGTSCRYLRCPADVCVNHLHNCCYRAPGTCPYRHIHIGERQRQEQQQQRRQQQQQQQQEQSHVPTIRATSSASSSSTSATSSSAAAAMSTWLSPYTQRTTASTSAAAEAAAVAPPRSSTASLHNNSNNNSNSGSNGAKTTSTAMTAVPAASRPTQLTTSAVAALMQQIHNSTHTLGLGRAAGGTAYNNNNDDQGYGGDGVLYDVGGARSDDDDDVCNDDDDDEDDDALQQALHASQGDDEDDMACSDAELQKLVQLQELFAHTEMYWLLLTLRACGGDVQAAANNLLRQEDVDDDGDSGSSGGEQDADADDVASDAALAQALADEEEEQEAATSAAAASAAAATAAGVDGVHKGKSDAQLLGTRTEALLTLCALFRAVEPSDVEAALCDRHDDFAAAYEVLLARSAALTPTRDKGNDNNKSHTSTNKSSARGRRNAWEGVTNMRHMQRAHLDALVAQYAGGVDGDVVHCVYDAVGGDVRTARDVLDQMVSAMCASSAVPPTRKGQQQQQQTTLTTTPMTAARTPAALLARQRALLQRPATAAARLCANGNNNTAAAAAAAAACGGALLPRVVTAQHADDSDEDECGGDAAAAAATRHTLASLSCDDVAHEYRAVAAEVQQYGDWMRVRRESYRVNACRLRAIRRAGEAFACGDAHAGRLWSSDARRLGAAYARLKRIALLALEQQRASSEATNVLDLHGFHADEVAGPLRRRVHLCRKRHIRRLRIVVGEGKHSVGGVSRLMPTVRALLRSDAELAAHVRLARLHQGYMDVRVLF